MKERLERERGKVKEREGEREREGGKRGRKAMRERERDSQQRGEMKGKKKKIMRVSIEDKTGDSGNREREKRIGIEKYKETESITKVT